MKASEGLDVLVLSTPYLLVLNYVSSLDRPPGATARQFVIVSHSLVDVDPEPVVISYMHDLEAGDRA
ncbi:MAG: hypothetical protein M3325_04795 [Actinomycetota bacterium]|nr:hypothetical protein [Actinomycetota bacterium]